MRIIDTNILLNYPNILNDTEDDITVTIRVIEELDGLKKNKNPEVAYKARRASHYILNNEERISFCIERKNKLSVDDEIIYLAKKKKWTVVTNDLNLQVKCWANKLSCISYSKKAENYTGTIYKMIELDDYGYNQELDEILSTRRPPVEMYENQFLIIQDKNNTTTDIYGKERAKTLFCLVYRNGQLEIIDNQYLKNQYAGTIKARNAEQECLFSLLKNKDISILLASGKYGSGKSYALINYALQELEKGNIDKIVYVPNNSFVDNTREMGYLPGDLIEKEIVHMGTLVDMVGMITVERMLQEETLEVAPISTMRGRNFVNSIIIVNEAQNLTEDHIKLLIARCGDDTRIFFDGDIKQVDSSVFKNKNGLKILSKLKDSPIFCKIFGTVQLVNIERSLTAQASAYLDELI